MELLSTFITVTTVRVIHVLMRKIMKLLLWISIVVQVTSCNSKPSKDLEIKNESPDNEVYGKGRRSPAIQIPPPAPASIPQPELASIPPSDPVYIPDALASIPDVSKQRELPVYIESLRLRNYEVTGRFSVPYTKGSWHKRVRFK